MAIDLAEPAEQQRAAASSSKAICCNGKVSKNTAQ